MRNLILIVSMILAGCAATAPPGVAMSEDETKACAAQGCSVWTEAELRTLIGKVANEARAMFESELGTHQCLRGRT